MTGLYTTRYSWIVHDVPEHEAPDVCRAISRAFVGTPGFFSIAQHVGLVRRSPLYSHSRRIYDMHITGDAVPAVMNYGGLYVSIKDDWMITLPTIWEEATE